MKTAKKKQFPGRHNRSQSGWAGLMTGLLVLFLAVSFFPGCSSVKHKNVFGVKKLGGLPFLGHDDENRVTVNFEKPVRVSELKAWRKGNAVYITGKKYSRQAYEGKGAVARKFLVLPLDIPFQQSLMLKYYWVDPDGKKHLLAFG